MCILCVVQRWSRKVATMLPWLVIPLIGLWALSQLLPPAFRFEITSPRLACVLVLLVTLFWYEVLMPQLSAWRIRRNARLRERKRIEAIEMDKLKKTATRRCRNCSTPYRDQNPGGGKFMCSYCGHISKRPVLDLPVSSSMGNSGILKDLVGKGGKILNGKAWDNGWICGQDWLENGNWGGGPVAGNLGNWTKSGGGPFGGDDHCLAERSYSTFFISACKYFSAFFLSVLRLWRKIFRASSSRDDTAADAERKRLSDKEGENGGNGQESRGEKARRKAEEKRQARLEKELMEEEERKQREEVARLVEERRKLRDEKMEAERESGKGSPRAKERECKKEAERKRRERKKEKDRGSSKSNSDVEELDKKAANKKSVSDRREQHRITPESVKIHGTEVGKSAAAGSHNRGNAGTRYLDRMKGTLLSSSRALSGSGFFGKTTSTSSVSREHKPNTLVDHTQTSMHKKEMVQPDLASSRSNVNGDDTNISHPVLAEPSQRSAPKKSWQQLFTRSPTVSPPSNSSVISRPNEKSQAEVHAPDFPSQPTSKQSFDNPINFGLPSPFNLPSFPIASSSSTTHPLSSSERMFPKIREHQFLPEDSEIFEDPCYVPDPVSLLGPVSESLDDFQLDVGFVKDKGMEKPRGMKPSEVTKPSPIESPLSRLKVSEERHPTSYLFPSTPRAQDNSSNLTDNRTWQMWNSSPLCQDGLGLVGSPANWLFPQDVNVPKNDDLIHPVPHKTMASLFKNDEKFTHSSQNAVFGNGQNGGPFNALPAGGDGPWLPKTFGGLTSSNQIMLKPIEDAAQFGLMYGNSSGPAGNHQFEMSSNSWSKKDGTALGSRDGVGNSPIGSRPHVGGLYSPPDVRSLWSYDKQI